MDAVFLEARIVIFHHGFANISEQIVLKPECSGWSSGLAMLREIHVSSAVTP